MPENSTENSPYPQFQDGPHISQATVCVLKFWWRLGEAGLHDLPRHEIPTNEEATTRWSRLTPAYRDRASFANVDEENRPIELTCSARSAQIFYRGQLVAQLDLLCTELVVWGLMDGLTMMTKRARIWEVSHIKYARKLDVRGNPIGWVERYTSLAPHHQINWRPVKPPLPVPTPVEEQS